MIYFLGISSGLGLISIDAIEAFKVDEPYVIAIEKEANGKYYLAQFKILILFMSKIVPTPFKTL